MTEKLLTRTLNKKTNKTQISMPYPYPNITLLKNEKKLPLFFQCLHGDGLHCADDDTVVSWWLCCSLTAPVQVPYPHTQEEEAEV